MSSFTEELKIIPKTARIIAGFAYVAAVVFWILMFLFSHDREMQSLPEAGKIAVVLLPGVILACYVLLIGYVNGDARRRGMRYVMWTLLAMFIPNAIGIILYFILRDPLMKPCPGCSLIVRPGFTFCPHCGTSLRPTCSNCGKAVEIGWANCPQCGTKLPGVGPAPNPIG
jgi:RNA polymerase subunit RPABC4/transcription elongation factor Spt4